MKLLLLSFVLTYVSAATVSSRCKWGPPYWCSSLENARECDATKHCIDTVWKHTILKQQSTETCTYCQLVVGELKSLLADKKTEDEIATEAAKACSLLPNPDWQDQCKGIVTEYTPEILEMLNNDLSSLTICATIGFCAGFEDNVSPYGVKSQVPEASSAQNSTCQDCTKFFKDVQQSVTSQETIDELLQLLNQTICSRLFGFEQLCMSFFKDNLPSALQLLADQVDPNEVCRIFGFCTTGKNQFKISIKNIFKDRKGELQYRSSEECDICKEGLGELVSLLRDRTTQQKIMDEVETLVCGALGGFEATCKQLVEEYAPIAFELLVNELDPTTLCETIGMCPVPTLYGQVKPVIKSKPQKPAMTGYVQESELCVLCQMAMQELDNLLQDNTTVATAEQFIEQICNKLSSEDLQKQCTAFVQEYGELVFSYLAKSLNPKNICAELSLCTSKINIAPLKISDDEVCTVCVLAITELENLVKNMSVDEIVGDLEQACNFIPVAQYKTMCNQYVKEYGTVVIQLLKDGTNPRSVCALVKACNSSVTSSTGKMTVPIPEHLKKGTSLAGKMTVPIPEDLNEDTAKKPSHVGAPSTECVVCNTVVYYIDILLQQNSSEAEILTLMKDACSQLGPLKGECITLVNAYGKQIIDELKKEANPKTVCNTLGLCNEKETAVKIMPMSIKVKSQDAARKPSDVGAPSTECVVCNTVVYYIDIFLQQNSSEAEILSLMKDACSALGALKDECTTLVDAYGKLIIDELKKEANPKTVCNALGLCNEKETPVKVIPMSIKVKSQVPCEVCTTAITVLKDLIGNQVTREGIASGLELLCNKLPANMQGDCDNLVVSFEPQIIDYILKKLGSGEICGKLGLCSAQDLISSLLTPYDMLPLQPMQPAQKISANPIECEGCKMVIDYVMKYIGEDKSENKIQEALDKVCATLPSTFSGFCKEMVDKYTKEIINFIILNEDAKEICKKLGFCSSTRLLPKPIHVKVLASEQETAPSSNTQTEVAGAVTCEVCQLALTYLEQLLEQKSTEAEIEKALETLCSYLPASLSSECTSLVDQYGPQIIQLLVDGVKPNQVCAELGLCTASQSSIKADAKCEVCKFVVGEVDTLLKQNKSQAEILDLLETVRSKLPGDLSSECEAFVKEYATLVISLLVQELDPDMICADLKLCTQQKKTSQSSLKNGVECEACKFVVGTADELLKQNKSKTEILDALETICSKLPGDLSSECEAFVKEYATLVISLLVQELDPDTICANLKLCTQQKKIQSPLTCEACKKVCQSVETWLHQNKSKDEIIALLYSLCDVFPDTVTVQCKSEMDMVAPKIIQMLQDNMDPKLVCPTLQLCDTPKIVQEKPVAKETDDTLYFHPKSHPKMLGTNKCMWGPAYWCASKENALSCDAMEHCQRHAWN